MEVVPVRSISPQRALVCGHRGNTVDRPEQTVPAYRRAVDLGATFVELDVQLTGDNRLVVLHDLTLERTTNGHGLARTARLDELRLLDAGAWFSPEWRGTRIPLIEEVLEFADTAGVSLCIELKGPDTGRTAAAGRSLGAVLASAGRLEQHYVSSFDLEALALVREEFPSLRLLPWMREDIPADLPSHLADARRLGALGLFHTASLLTREQIRELHDAGLVMWVWSDIDQASLEHAAGLGADVISVGDVAACLEVLDSMGGRS